MKLESLRSVVRPLISTAMAAALIVGFFKGMVDGTEFLAVAVVCIYWWYQSRKKSEPPAK